MSNYRQKTYEQQSLIVILKKAREGKLMKNLSDSSTAFLCCIPQNDINIYLSTLLIFKFHKNREAGRKAPLRPAKGKSDCLSFLFRKLVDPFVHTLDLFEKLLFVFSKHLFDFGF